MRKIWRRFGPGSVALLLPLLSLNMIAATVYASPGIFEYPVPSSNIVTGGGESSITSGPDGNLWFVQSTDNDVGSITPGGTVRIYQQLDPNTHPVQIVTGSDGALWFTQATNASPGYGEIGRITTGGIVSESRLNAPYDRTNGLMIGPDGNPWFTEWGPGGAALGNIKPSGQITDYQLANPNSIPSHLAYNGGFWFTDPGTNSIGYLNPGFPVVEYPLPTPNADPDGIALGEGGAWFTERASNKVAEVPTTGQTQGTITEYPIPTPNSDPQEIAVGPSGNLWFTEQRAGSIARITNAGLTITEYPIPTQNSGPQGITTTSSGVWFTEAGVNGMTPIDKIGFISKTAFPASPVLASPSSVAVNHDPVLSWGGVSGADFYNIYTANGDRLLDTISANNTSYTDTAPIMSNYYYVTAVTGTDESFPSNTVKYLYDPVPPVVTYSLSPAANDNGWSNSSVTVTFNCSDNLGHASCTTPVTVGTEGITNVTGTSTDPAGNTASVTATVKIDETGPVLPLPAWSANPLALGQSTTMSIAASDGGSGVSTVSYSVNDDAPQPMVYNPSTSTWQAVSGSDLAVGTYPVTTTATDNVGNTTTIGDVLAVYNVNNGYVTGHADFQPNSSDTLPIPLDTSKKPAKLVLGFTNVMSPASGSFSADYKIKNNYNEFSLASTNINWVVVQDSTHASTLGHADLTTYVNGVKTVTNNAPVRINMTLGSNGVPDSVVIEIYSPAANPGTDAPAYVMIDNDTGGSNLVIHP